MRAATLGDFWRLLGRAIDRESKMAGEAVTAMIVAADAGDNPLADRREDREAAAAREKMAKVGSLAKGKQTAATYSRASDHPVRPVRLTPSLRQWRRLTRHG